MSHFHNDILISSDISKTVLKSIINKKDLDLKKIGIESLREKIKILKKIYNKKEKEFQKPNYKFEIFWNLVEEKYNKKISLVKRSQKEKEEKFNLLYSDFAKIFGFLPSLLTLLIFENEIKKLMKYENFFNKLQESGNFNDVSFKQKILIINTILKGKITLVTPLCPDYEHVYVGLGLYKYTFNKLNDGLGLIGKRLFKIIKKTHRVLRDFKISFEHHAYYGDFEAYSKEICERVGSDENEFIHKLNKSSKKMKNSVSGINSVGLIVNKFSSKKKWQSLCKRNENNIKKKMNSDKNFKNLVLKILESRLELYKSWYPSLNEKQYLKLLVQQGAEYTSMGDLFKKNFKNPIVLGLDHPKMGVFYSLNSDIPVIYGRPGYI